MDEKKNSGNREKAKDADKRRKREGREKNEWGKTI